MCKSLYWAGEHRGKRLLFPFGTSLGTFVCVTISTSAGIIPSTGKLFPYPLLIQTQAYLQIHF